eukprot:559195-Rhodomonas_salina.6
MTTTRRRVPHWSSFGWLIGGLEQKVPLRHRLPLLVVSAGPERSLPRHLSRITSSIRSNGNDD